MPSTVALRIPVQSMPCDERISTGWHSHTCPGCGCVWGHDGSRIGSLDHAAHTLAHTCPACGKLKQYTCR